MTYEFRCLNGHDHEVWTAVIGRPPAPVCPVCGAASESLMSEPLVRVYGNPTTIGQQAEINTRRLGKELSQKKARSTAARTRQTQEHELPDGARRIPLPTERPFWRPEGKEGVRPMDISKLTTKDKIQKYINTGKQ